MSNLPLYKLVWMNIDRVPCITDLNNEFLTLFKNNNEFQHFFQRKGGTAYN